MDYSDLVSSIQTGDDKTTNRMCKEAAPILKKYLISNVGSSPEDADDAIQEMFEYIIKKIKQNDIENPSGLLAYMLTTSRHCYYKILKKRDKQLAEDLKNDPGSKATQIWDIVDHEKQEILKRCLSKLKKSYLEFITYLFDYPDAETEDIAEYFDISTNNAWTRKHRIIRKLSKCIKTNL